VAILQLFSPDLQSKDPAGRKGGCLVTELKDAVHGSLSESPSDWRLKGGDGRFARHELPLILFRVLPL